VRKTGSRKSGSCWGAGNVGAGALSDGKGLRSSSSVSVRALGEGGSR